MTAAGVAANDAVAYQSAGGYVTVRSTPKPGGTGSRSAARRVAAAEASWLRS